MKNIIILGSTGSIGTQTLEVIAENRDRFSVIGLSCGSKINLLIKQIEAFSPKAVAVSDVETGKTLKEEFSRRNIDIKLFTGDKCNEYLIEFLKEEANLILNALMGMRGLVPTLCGIENGIDIALANKETLVSGGSLVMKSAEENGVNIIPVDSEHSAIFQSLKCGSHESVKKILLTASGGPFRGRRKKELEEVKPEDALKHPNWNMGKKITIDSATMMNKGLEIIEAKWLFNIPLEKIEVLIHPESILHSAVEFTDGAIIGQMGIPDMKTPISYALGYPERLISSQNELNFFEEASHLTFEKPDMDTFRCLSIAIESATLGGIFPAVMNAANEVLVEKFLSEKIGFNQIPEMIEEVMKRCHTSQKTDGTGEDLTLEDIIRADSWARKETERVLEEYRK